MERAPAGAPGALPRNQVFSGDPGARRRLFFGRQKKNSYVKIFAVASVKIKSVRENYQIVPVKKTKVPMKISRKKTFSKNSIFIRE